MTESFICDAVRTAIGRYGGVLSSVRPDDLAAVPIKALMDRNINTDWAQIDDVILGCANQAGEDNRNVARMALLLAGVPESVPAATINRLCGSGMDTIGIAARSIKAGEANMVVAGGVESMSRAPFVMGKSSKSFSRDIKIEDTTLGWRFVNKLMQELHGIDSMPETAENVAEEFQISRTDQDAYALRSQERAEFAINQGIFSSEIIPVPLLSKEGKEVKVVLDEHPRPQTTLDGLSKLPTPFRDGGTVTAGNASGINDGASALLIASETAILKHQLKPRARILGAATAGIAPRIMGMGPVPATQKLLSRLDLDIGKMDVIEFNEAFAAQTLGVMRALGLPDNADHVNPNGGAIALGHPLGMSGARLVLTAANQLERIGGTYALCAMCIGVGQGIAIVIERV